MSNQVAMHLAVSFGKCIQTVRHTKTKLSIFMNTDLLYYVGSITMLMWGEHCPHNIRLPVSKVFQSVTAICVIVRETQL